MAELSVHIAVDVDWTEDSKDVPAMELLVAVNEAIKLAARSKGFDVRNKDISSSLKVG